MSPFDFPMTQANHVPLSPLSFLTRAASVHPDRLAVVHGSSPGDIGVQTAERCRRLASALAQARHRQGRYRRGDGTQHPTDARGAFRRADGWAPCSTR